MKTKKSSDSYLNVLKSVEELTKDGGKLDLNDPDTLEKLNNCADAVQEYKRTHKHPISSVGQARLNNIKNLEKLLNDKNKINLPDLNRKQANKNKNMDEPGLGF